jgi:hypothetical protein
MPRSQHAHAPSTRPPTRLQAVLNLRHQPASPLVPPAMTPCAGRHRAAGRHWADVPTEVGGRADTEPSSDAPRPAPADAHAPTAEQPSVPQESDVAPAVAEDDDRAGSSGDEAEGEGGEASQDVSAGAVVRTGFELEDGQPVLAYVHGAWQPAVVGESGSAHRRGRLPARTGPAGCPPAARDDRPRPLHRPTT